MVECPGCKKPISIDSNFCQHCSYAVATPRRMAYHLQAGECRYCGERKRKGEDNRLKLEYTDRPIREYFCKLCGNTSVTVEVFIDDLGSLIKAQHAVSELIRSKRIIPTK